jgi:hypothetical protein
MGRLLKVGTWGRRVGYYHGTTTTHLFFVAIHPLLKDGLCCSVTNFDKCVITPIRCDESVVAATLQVLPCMVEQPLVDAIAARLPTWKAGLLTKAGRVLLTKVTLSAILVHLSITCFLS